MSHGVVIFLRFNCPLHYWKVFTSSRDQETALVVCTEFYFRHMAAVTSRNNRLWHWSRTWVSVYVDTAEVVTTCYHLFFRFLIIVCIAFRSKWVFQKVANITSINILTVHATLPNSLSFPRNNTILSVPISFRIVKSPTWIMNTCFCIIIQYLIGCIISPDSLRIGAPIKMCHICSALTEFPYKFESLSDIKQIQITVMRTKTQIFPIRWEFEIFDSFSCNTFIQDKFAWRPLVNSKSSISHPNRDVSRVFRVNTNSITLVIKVYISFMRFHSSIIRYVHFAA